MNFKNLIKTLILAKKREYSAIRREYEAAIYALFLLFLTEDEPIREIFQTKAKSIITSAFILAYNLGVKDGGNSKRDKGWIKERIEKELAFILLLFVQLEEMRQRGDFDAQNTARSHADGYAFTLDGVYNQGKVTGAGNQPLTFLGKHGKPPEFPCKECDYWYGKTRPASFWSENNLIPGQPGNPNFTCGGWRCMHTLEDENGVDFLW